MLDGRMCCVREYQNNLSAFFNGGCCINYNSLALLRKMRSGEVIFSILAFNITPQNHSSTFHPTTCLDVAGAS
jgi:hypothetical protein